MSSRVLVIDDEDYFREDLARILTDSGYECQTAADGSEGLAKFESFNPEVVLCDIAMPKKGGIEVLDEVMRYNPKSSVIMITAHGSLDSAISAFRKGASDYITKPLVIEDVLQKIEWLIKYKRLEQEIKFLRREISRDARHPPLLGQSKAMKDVLDLIEKVAPTRSTVIITGESGTGKEIVARLVHQASGPKNRDASNTENGLPFVAISCAGIPGELLESELFGHVRGAFTGAVEERVGFFELAGAGTLFLDEMGEMPLYLQSKLLRVLEQKEFVPVGGAKTLRLEARVITATNQDLKKLVREGKFREDLYFRIAVFEIPLPSLRERPSDIPLLVDHFINGFNKEFGKNCKGVGHETMPRLLAHSWPGNVRELRNVVERAMILSEGDYIGVESLPAEIGANLPPLDVADDLRQVMLMCEREHIRRVIQASGGNKKEAARRLGVDYSTLYRKMSGSE